MTPEPAASLPNDLARKVQRARAACVLYAIVWLALPCLVAGFLLMRGVIARSGHAGEIQGLLWSLGTLGLLTLVLGSTLFTWFIVDVAHATGRSGLPPFVACVLALFAPGVTLAFALGHVERAIRGMGGMGEGDAHAERLPVVWRWAGPILLFLQACSITVASVLEVDSDSVLTFLFVGTIVAYTASRIAIAFRLRSMLDELLPRAEAEAIRAAFSQSVGG